ATTSSTRTSRPTDHDRAQPRPRAGPGAGYGGRPGGPPPPRGVRRGQDAADRATRLRGALADADNLRKRNDRLVADARLQERATVAAAWLPIVDNLERAL